MLLAATAPRRTLAEIPGGPASRWSSCTGDLQQRTHRLTRRPVAANTSTSYLHWPWLSMSPLVLGGALAPRPRPCSRRHRRRHSGGEAGCSGTATTATTVTTSWASSPSTTETVQRRRLLTRTSRPRAERFVRENRPPSLTEWTGWNSWTCDTHPSPSGRLRDDRRPHPPWDRTRRRRRLG